MKHYFLDTNIVIDFLAHREPFWAGAAESMQASFDKQVRLRVASLSFANIYYIIRRTGTAEYARELLVRLERLVRIVAIDDVVIRQALASSFKDFEDGIQHYLRRFQLSLLVTPRTFRPIPCQ
ncbi:type II toxin-antitoxin system VapC family toxin [Hymenobacter terricola]|uniref:type II toxin-antitoxin system VapC family toxin n=1 Tax=Hymenobacter terricola TaxID=2819236 RepID=UPI001B303500|nr:PIN domain-containing protein [Hymenobacter terricola]